MPNQYPDSLGVKHARNGHNAFMTAGERTTAPSEFEKFASFGEAADAVLGMLRELLQLELWLVTRVHEDQWIVLHSYGSGAFSAGDVLPLKATICNELLAGNGPNIAPDISQIVSYARAPILKKYPVGSYAGAPL